MDFDPGPGDFNLSSGGSGDVFVSKLDNDGNFLWTKSMGGINADQGMSIALDLSGNIYTTGYFQEIADFDPGPGTNNLTSNGESDIFVFKLDSNGDLLWARSMGGKGLDLEFGIALDDRGNVYTTGYFQETADFDPGPGVFNLESNGSEDIFVSKFDSKGNFLSANGMGGTGLDRGVGRRRRRLHHGILPRDSGLRSRSRRFQPDKQRQLRYFHLQAEPSSASLTAGAGALKRPSQP